MTKVAEQDFDKCISDSNIDSFEVVNDVDQASIDKAAGLEIISLRLETELIKDFEYLANQNGVECHTLMRRVLKNYVEEGLT